MVEVSLNKEAALVGVTGADEEEAAAHGLSSCDSAPLDGLGVAYARDATWMVVAGAAVAAHEGESRRIAQRTVCACDNRIAECACDGRHCVGMRWRILIATSLVFVAEFFGGLLFLLIILYNNQYSSSPNNAIASFDAPRATWR